MFAAKSNKKMFSLIKKINNNKINMNDYNKYFYYLNIFIISYYLF